MYSCIDVFCLQSTQCSAIMPTDFDFFKQTHLFTVRIKYNINKYQSNHFTVNYLQNGPCTGSCLLLIENLLLTHRMDVAHIFG